MNDGPRMHDGQGGQAGRLRKKCRNISATVLYAIAAAVPTGCATREPASPPYSGGTIVTTNRIVEIERGPGAEYCREMDQVLNHLEAKEFDEARALLAMMLARFTSLEESGKTLLSFASQAE